MLKHLFTSKARIKLLTVFLLNPSTEYFIRELTRKLDEQINSVRRELSNLKKLGLLKCKFKNRKKFYIVNQDFILFNDLRSIIVKSLNSKENIIKSVLKLGEISFLLISGVFLEKESTVDLLIVGEVDKKKIETYLNTELEIKRPIRFSIMSEEDFLYRIKCKDKFIHDLLRDKNNIIGINRLNVDL